MTVERIKNGIYKWGVYPALFFLKELQDNEQYEQCAIVKEALDEIIKKHELYLNTKVDDDTLDDTYKKILQELNKSETTHNNMLYYIYEFRKNLK